MTDLKRHGSLGFYYNSKKEKRKIIPSVKGEKCYFIKVGMTTQKTEEGRFVAVTLLQRIPHKRINETQWRINLSEIDAKCVMRKDITKEIDTTLSEDQLYEKISTCEYVDAISFNKGKGTLGPVRRRGLSLGLPGVRRSPGSMGGRQEGRISYRRPFAGRTGFTRRTIYSLKTLGAQDVKDYTSLRYYIKEGTLLTVKGSIGGCIGRVVCLRPAVRK